MKDSGVEKIDLRN